MWLHTFDSSRVNFHILHADIANDLANNCHIEVPHGWKNKAFLVNLNDVGPEVGLPTGTVIDRYTDPNWEGNGLKMTVVTGNLPDLLA